MAEYSRRRVVFFVGLGRRRVYALILQIAGDPDSDTMDRPFPIAIGEFAEGDANIFWDVDDYSKLGLGNPYLTFKKFKSALEKKCYHGPVSVRAYVDENTLPKEFITKCEIAGIQIILVPQGDKCSRVFRMLKDLLFWALNRRTIDEETKSRTCTPSTLVLLSKNINEDTMFSRVYNRAFHANFNVFIAPYESLILPSEAKMQIGSFETEEPLPEQMVFIISGPSGGGSDAVVKRLREVRPSLHFLKTVTSCETTTRSGEDYSLVKKHEFLRMVKDGELLQHSKEKGISKREISESMAKEEDIVIKMDDIVEARCLRELLGRAVFIYLVAEIDVSMPVRSKEQLVTIAREEAWYLELDYFVFHAIGSSLHHSVDCLESIIDLQMFKLH